MPKILLIEDDPATRRQTAQILRFEGFEVLEAENGAIGTELARENIPDLIICDIMMPVMDGFKVLQNLKERRQTALIPFIFVTAKITSTDRRQGMTDGADDFITKPYDPDDLIRSIHRRLEKRNRQQQELKLKSEELSLTVATALPQELLESLTHITTTTNLLALKYSESDPQVAEMHRAVTEEAQRIQQLMRRLQLYAQLPALYTRRFELARTKEATNTKPLVETTSKRLCGKWGREQDLKLTIDQATLPLATNFFVMIIEELVDNACKFSEPGSVISIVGENKQAFWSLSVVNAGAEMSQDAIGNIGAFKQFWVGEAKPRGLGIGLALTQGIARLHSCEISIQSAEHTTSVSVLFPLET